MNISIDTILIIVEAIVLAVLAFLIFMIIKKKKRLRKGYSVESARRREEELDELLRNYADISPTNASGGKLRPYEEKYYAESNFQSSAGGPSKAKEPGPKRSPIRIELRVTTPMSDKKYQTDVYEELSIGTDPSNDLVVDSKLAAFRQCVIFRNEDQLMIRNISPDKPVAVERSKEKRKLTDNALLIHDQDRFYLLGDVTIEIRIF